MLVFITNKKGVLLVFVDANVAMCSDILQCIVISNRIESNR